MLGAGIAITVGITVGIIATIGDCHEDVQATASELSPGVRGFILQALFVCFSLFRRPLYGVV
jgi:hypothetical protein